VSWEIIFVLLLLLAAVFSFIREKFPVDITALVAFGVLIGVAMLSGSERLPTLDQFMQVFANPAPLTIAAMFIISAALEKCGAIDRLASITGRAADLPYPAFVAVLVLGVALISAFVNNTPVVVVFMPVIMSLARRMNTPASRLLIPLSYASIFGGVCTLMGTSTNILMSGIMQQSGLEPLGMFELAAVGVPLLFVGMAYLVVLGPKILPARETLTSILSEEERREYITEAYLQHGSELAGKSYNEGFSRRAKGVRLVEIVRDGVAVEGDIANEPLQEGDRLMLACRASALASARSSMEGIDFGGEMGLDFEQIAAHEGAIVEAVIGPRSTIVGHTVSQVNFRQRFRMILLAVHRNGRNVRTQLDTLRLQFGDTLLMMGTDRAIEQLRRSDDMILLDRPPLPTADRQGKMPIVLATILGLITVVSFNLMPIVAAAILAVAILFVTRCIESTEAYEAIEWRILVLIYGMLGIGAALEASGLAQLIGDSLGGLTTNPLLLLFLLYLITTILTEILSNNATVVIMAPIALSIAAATGLDPRPLLIAICVASSASFSTPIGYQTNTYVYSVGGYRFSDFLKAGIPLNLAYMAATLLIVPLFWSF